MLTFPSSPQPGDSYLSYIFDGVKWGVQAGVGGVAGVSSLNTRVGPVTLLLADVTGATGSGSAAQASLGLATVAASGAYADLSGRPAASLPLTGGTLTGALTVASGNIAASAGNVSAANAVLGDRMLGVRSGSYGGVVGSWESSSGKATGLRVSGTNGAMEFGPADATSGGLTAVSATLSTAGALNVNSTIAAVGGVFADSAGNFGLYVTGNQRTLLYSGAGGYQDAIDLGTGLRSWISYDGTTTQMSLDVSGNLTILGGTATKPGGGSWTAPSDARIKDVSGNYEHGLAEVCALQPVRYRYKSGVEVLHDDPEVTPAPMFQSDVTEADFIGLIAQDTEPHLPECVGVSGQTVTVDGQTVSDLRTMDTTPLVMALINAVKTLAHRLDQLET